MTALYGVITFLVVLGPLVILHELGHLFAARLMKVKVIEFGFGFPPRSASGPAGPVSGSTTTPHSTKACRGRTCALGGR